MGMVPKNVVIGNGFGIKRRVGTSMLHKLVHFDGGFQDAEGILSTEMLVAAIILSIVVTLHVASFGHDVMVEGDLRHAAFDAIRGKKLDEDSYHRFISGRLFVDGYVAVSCSAYSLLSSAAIYVSLIFSGARSDDVLFRRWWRVGRVLIIMSYVPLLVSIFFFLRLNHDSVYMVYPKYNWNTVLNVTDAMEAASPLVAAVPRNLAAARGSAAAGTSVGQGGGAGGSSSDYAVVGERRSYGYDVAATSKNFKLGMNIALSITAVILVSTHVWLHCFRGKEESSPTIPSPPSSPVADSEAGRMAPLTRASTLACLAEQSQLMREQNELLQLCMNQQLGGSFAAHGACFPSKELSADADFV
jgi:hypothetical protein